jgi:hypothetical protein
MDSNTTRKSFLILRGGDECILLRSFAQQKLFNFRCHLQNGGEALLSASKLSTVAAAKDPMAATTPLGNKFGKPAAAQLKTDIKDGVGAAAAAAAAAAANDRVQVPILRLIHLHC